LKTAASAGGAFALPPARRRIATASAVPDLTAVTLEEKVGQLVIARLADWPLMEEYARQGVISGMTPSLTGKPPAEVAEFTNRFQRLSKYPLLMGWAGVSYSGGTEVRLDQAMRLGAARSPELCYQAAKIEAVESRALGFHMAGTPNVDVNTNPDNPIINLRALSDDPQLVIDLGAELCRGAIDGGAASLLMHFPGHGASSSDSHIAIPEIRRSLAELEAVDLKPFAELIRRKLARLVCTNHCCYPALAPAERTPATVSRKIVTGLLRNKLGYDGVIISDSLTMKAMKDNYGIEEAAILAVAAGHDLILELSTAMQPKEIERAFAAAQEADVVVFGLFTRVRSYVPDAIKLAKPYRDLIRRIAAGGRSLALLNFGNPYAMADLPKPALSLCTFSDAKHSIDAAVDVLFGTLKPKGLLPVRISKAYPFGYGLST
jgi:beta-N-acetylhexosaminidase